jgi:carbonic anhydrase/acetyltransferase-like protein (isoleucine patch superfamily)
VVVAESVHIGEDAIVGDACGDVTLIGGKAVVQKGQSVAAGSEVDRKAGTT